MTFSCHRENPCGLHSLGVKAQMKVPKGRRKILTQADNKTVSVSIPFCLRKCYFKLSLHTSCVYVNRGDTFISHLYSFHTSDEAHGFCLANNDSRATYSKLSREGWHSHYKYRTNAWVFIISVLW